MKPAFVGLAGPALTPVESVLLQTYPPLGVILFTRNIEAPTQLKALIDSIKKIHPETLLMIDQEGGRVARLKPPHWNAHPPAQNHTSPRAAWLTGALIGLQCRAENIDLVAAPVLDLATAGANPVIGDRAFSENPQIVAEYGAAFAAGLLAAGIQPIAKHAPGHGRATADSHLTLPILDTVTESDIAPFAANRHLPWMMTAHIRYNAQDMQNPATLSPAIISKIIRNPEAIGFNGVLITDDLAMHALTGTPADRATRALAAGCDVALHCSGILEETENLLEALPEISEPTKTRIARARQQAVAAHDKTLDPKTLTAERAALFA